MCGIAGFVSASLKIEERKRILDRMLKVITHRGPDDQGEYLDKNAVMGMRRLSVIDIQGGHQPVFNEDQSVSIVFNGEIFNHIELRDELSGKGHVFRSNSDTEVIIHAYEEYGYACLDRLNGMFGFAIWDTRSRSLFIARDRIGVKPIHYYFDGSQFIFGSEMKSILEFPEVPRTMDIEALNLFLAYNFIPAPYTIFRGIRKLLPGHYLVFCEGSEPTVEKYWDVKMDDRIHALSFEEHKKNIRELLFDSVKRRMISDVPLGAFLSGGIDSSIIVGVMAQTSPRPIETFNISFEGHKVFDESVSAREVANFNHANHHEFVLDAHDLQEILPKLIWDLDEPFGDRSAIPTYYVSRETRKHVTVALSGDGGDELFGGYTKYTGEHWLNLYNKLPVLLRKQVLERVLEILPAGRGNRFKELVRKAKKFIASNSEKPEYRHYSLLVSFSEEMRGKMLKSQDLLVEETARNLVSQYFNSFAGNDTLFKMSFTDLKLSLPDDMLTKVDKMSMLNSLEARTPFLDYRLVEYAFNIPSRFKLVGTNGKFILKEAFNDLIPTSILSKPKAGFDVPIGEWFKKELNSLLRDTLSESHLMSQGIFNYQFVNEMLNAHMKEQNDFTPQIWSLVVFVLWYDMYMK